MSLRIKSAGIFLAVLLLPAASYAANLYSITVTGRIVADNATGDLGAALQGRSFEYNATFSLDLDETIGSRINPGGFTVYQLDDGGNKYFNSACVDGPPVLAGSNCISSTLVEFEFNDNLALNWMSDPELQFLGLDVPDATPFDSLVLGFLDPDSSIEIYASLLFTSDWFSGIDPESLPTTIDISEYVFGGGEFAIIENEQGDASDFAQFIVESANLSQVPLPASIWLFAAALAGLIRAKRRA